MKILVTGGAGFVGSHLIEFLIQNRHFPIIVDNLNSGNYKNIKKHVDSGKAKFIKLDIRNLNHVMKLPKVNAVIHLAAIASVVESIKNPILVNDVNVNGTLNILEFCRKKNIRKLVFTSSAAIFGNYEQKISETTRKIPTTVYGSTKLTGEHYCKIYSDLFGIKITILRPFNIYGPRQNNSYAGVISKFMDRLSKHKSPIIFGTGKQTRDFIHVKDVCKAFLSALNYNHKLIDVFNLGTGKSISINKLANIFLKKTNQTKLPIIYKKAIPGVVVNNSTSIYKIKKNLKFKPEIKLDDGISDLIAWNKA